MTERAWTAWGVPGVRQRGWHQRRAASTVRCRWRESSGSVDRIWLEQRILVVPQVGKSHDDGNCPVKLKLQAVHLWSSVASSINHHEIDSLFDLKTVIIFAIVVMITSYISVQGISRYWWTRLGISVEHTTHFWPTYMFRLTRFYIYLCYSFKRQDGCIILKL